MKIVPSVCDVIARVPVVRERSGLAGKVFKFEKTSATYTKCLLGPVSRKALKPFDFNSFVSKTKRYIRLKSLV